MVKIPSGQPFVVGCLQLAFLVVFPTIIACISRSYRDYVTDRLPHCDLERFPYYPCTRPILYFFPRRIPSYVADKFPERTPDRFAKLFQISYLVLSKK